MHEGDVPALIPIDWLLPPATHRRCWFGRKKSGRAKPQLRLAAAPREPEMAAVSAIRSRHH
jgi:hypothetical protein